MAELCACFAAHFAHGSVSVFPTAAAAADSCFKQTTFRNPLYTTYLTAHSSIGSWIGAIQHQAPDRQI